MSTKKSLLIVIVALLVTALVAPVQADQHRGSSSPRVAEHHRGGLFGGFVAIERRPSYGCGYGYGGYYPSYGYGVVREREVVVETAREDYSSLPNYYSGAAINAVREQKMNGGPQIVLAANTSRTLSPSVPTPQKVVSVPNQPQVQSDGKNGICISGFPRMEVTARCSTEKSPRMPMELMFCLWFAAAVVVVLFLLVIIIALAMRGRQHITTPAVATTPTAPRPPVPVPPAPTPAPTIGGPTGPGAP